MDSRMVLVLLACLTLCSTSPTVAPETDALPEDDETLAENYLSHFYAGNSAMRIIARPSFNDSLKSMQSFFGLEVTGTLDNETVKVMKEPRCGVPDIGRYAHFRGRPKWKESIITYRITNYNRLLSQSQVDATIAKAFQLYSDVIPLDFKQIYSGTADMMILFGSGEHGDFDPFDGRNGVLAHATSPGWGEGGDTHFDNDENWTLTQRGINLLLVAAHEFGHALGLDHSRERRALMYPTYKYVQTYGYKLPDDDRRGVQALYGVRTQLVPQPTPPDIGPNPQNDKCSKDLAFDAATSRRGDLLFFKNGYYWTKSTLFQGIRFTKVSTQWPQINYVDAAYEVPNEDVVYLFEGRNYWGIRAYANTKLPGYPKPLTNLGLPSNVNKVDAAVFVPTTRKTLFFVNSQYWSYDELTGKMDNGYPRYITYDFPGISSKVDAAFLNRDYLYFCDGARQTEYNLANKRVNRVLLNYYWLNCF